MAELTQRIADDIGFIGELITASNIADLRRTIGMVVKRLGFSDYAFVRLDCSDDPGRLYSTLPELIDAYYRAKYYENDLVLLHASKSRAGFFRSTLDAFTIDTPYDCSHVQCTRDIRELNKSFGYFDYYNVPAKALHGGGHVLLSVTKRGMITSNLRRVVSRCINDLSLLCEAIEYVSITRFREEGCPVKEKPPIVNPRPLLVLNMLANDDMNITRVAAELGLNVVTANRHLQAARRAFGVNTNYSAIRLGIKYGLIEFR